MDWYTCPTYLLVLLLLTDSLVQFHVFTAASTPARCLDLFLSHRRATSIIRLKFMLTRHRDEEKVNA